VTCWTNEADGSIEEIMGVAGKYDADGGFSYLEDFIQVEGEYRNQQPEAEVEQEVGCQNQAITGSYKSVLGHVNLF
jgi:hypothetical protein